MVTRIGGSRPPRLYIEEWMATIPGLDRMRLAQRMGVSPGTVTKKLAQPHKIDGEWLARFAEGLGRKDPTDLYRDPAAPTPDELLAGMSQEQRDEVINFVDFLRKKAG